MMSATDVAINDFYNKWHDELVRIFLDKSLHDKYSDYTVSYWTPRVINFFTISDAILVESMEGIPVEDARSVSAVTYWLSKLRSLEFKPNKTSLTKDFDYIAALKVMHGYLDNAYEDEIILYLKNYNAALHDLKSKLKTELSKGNKVSTNKTVALQQDILFTADEEELWSMYTKKELIEDFYYFWQENLIQTFVEKRKRWKFDTNFDYKVDKFGVTASDYTFYELANSALNYEFNRFEFKSYKDAVQGLGTELVGLKNGNKKDPQKPFDFILQSEWLLRFYYCMNKHCYIDEYNDFRSTYNTALAKLNSYLFHHRNIHVK